MASCGMQFDFRPKCILIQLSWSKNKSNPDICEIMPNFIATVFLYKTFVVINYET